MAETNWADKRESTRVETKLVVIGGLLEGDETEVTGDVSLGGARARLPYIPAVLKVEVRLPSGLQIPGELYVVRPAGGGGADVIIRFKELDTDKELALAKFIDDFEISREHAVPPPGEEPKG